MTMSLSSDAFGPGESIPRRYTADDENISPPLQWSNLPAGTAALVLICEDPDAPRPEPWVHWLLYDIPATLGELREGLATDESIDDPAPMKQGCNTFEKSGYGGPAPPRKHGVHHYIFTLYALRQPTRLPAACGKADLLRAMEGNILESARLVGIYER